MTHVARGSTTDAERLGEHETGNAAGARPINGTAKQPVVRRALDEIVDKRPDIAISAAALPAGTEEFALVAAFRQGWDEGRAARPGMPPVLLASDSEVHVNASKDI